MARPGSLGLRRRLLLAEREARLARASLVWASHEPGSGPRTWQEWAGGLAGWERSGALPQERRDVLGEDAKGLALHVEVEPG